MDIISRRPPYAPTGESAPYDLAQARNIGLHSIEGLGTSISQPKARDDLIKYQQRLVLPGQASQGF